MRSTSRASLCTALPAMSCCVRFTRCRRGATAGHRPCRGLGPTVAPRSLARARAEKTTSWQRLRVGGRGAEWAGENILARLGLTSGSRHGGRTWPRRHRRSVRGWQEPCRHGCGLRLLARGDVCRWTSRSVAAAQGSGQAPLTDGVTCVSSLGLAAGLPHRQVCGLPGTGEREVARVVDGGPAL
jgi:hypothetical protein